MKERNDTMNEGIIIRAEEEKDYAKITEVNDLAFGQKNEGLLVERLRQTENYIPALSLVAELNDEIIGHILFYPVTVQSAGSRYPTLSLGPMAVIPEYQRKGVGSRQPAGFRRI
jgi:predicted N-acetyltransferase YhbS